MMNPKEATLEGRYAPRDQQVLTRQVGNEMVLVDMHNGIYHGLNAVAVEIWGQLDGERSLREVVDAVVEAYPTIAVETIEADTLALMQSLIDNDLVVAR